MQGHLGGDPDDLPTLASDPETDLVILGCDDVGVVATDPADRLDAHHGIAAASLGLSDRRVPLQVGEAVIDRAGGRSLPAPSANDSDVAILLQQPASTFQPALSHLAIAVHELDELHRGICLAESFESLVPGPRCRERARQVQLHDLGAQRPGQRGTPISGVRVDVDDRLAASHQRGQATTKPLTFVSADDHGTNRAHDIHVLP